jgi:hypothetical protein
MLFVGGAYRLRVPRLAARRNSRIAVCLTRTRRRIRAVRRQSANGGQSSARRLMGGIGWMEVGEWYGKEQGQRA